MEATRNDILNCLGKFSCNDCLLDELQAIIKKHGRKTYTVIFHVLTNLDLPHSKAEQCWRDIIAHFENLKSVVGRQVNLLTVICDYFCSINKNLNNPKIIEIHLFEKTSRSSRYDSLTGLMNRQTLEDTLSREVSRSRRHEIELSVIFFDLDNFKATNDTYGHLAGDFILKQVADLITEEKRAEDIAARYGGEEMVLVLPETSKNNALIVAERIRKRIESARFGYEGIVIKTTASGGLASFPIDAKNEAELVKHADEAMYKAKASGKNRIILYSKEKRRNIRIDVATEIMVRKLDPAETSPEITALTRSISIDGILFESGSSFAVGTKTQLCLPLRDNVPVNVIGTVSRVESLGKKRYGVSVSFLQEDKSTKAEISRYLVPHASSSLAPLDSHNPAVH